MSNKSITTLPRGLVVRATDTVGSHSYIWWYIYITCSEYLPLTHLWLNHKYIVVSTACIVATTIHIVVSIILTYSCLKKINYSFFFNDIVVHTTIVSSFLHKKNKTTMTINKNQTMIFSCFSNFGIFVL